MSKSLETIRKLGFGLMRAVMAADTRTNVSSAENARKSVRSIFGSGMS